MSCHECTLVSLDSCNVRNMVVIMIAKLFFFVDALHLKGKRGKAGLRGTRGSRGEKVRVQK